MSNQKPNSGKHIDDIIGRTTCDKHNSPQGFPCFEVYYDSRKGEIGAAICGSRIKQAGFNGKINPTSLSRGGVEGTPRYRRR